MLIRWAEPEDADGIVRLIRRRIGWMDSRGLKNQWNDVDYLTIYPPDYFRQNIGSFLIAEEDGILIGAVAAYTEDRKWPGKREPAFYLHHLVADEAFPGTGRRLLDAAEREALRRGIRFIRGDSNLRSQELSRYYEARGCRAKGLIREGSYIGVLREKRLDGPNPDYAAIGFLDTEGLTDGEISLQLERKAQADPERGYVPAYHFAILDPSGRKAGTCDLRIGYGESLYYGGHIGYAVDAGYRGHHYAARACRLLFGLARRHGMGYLIITCDPENTASARTALAAGFEWVERAVLPETNEMRLTKGKEEAEIYAVSLDGIR